MQPRKPRKGDCAKTKETKDSKLQCKRCFGKERGLAKMGSARSFLRPATGSSRVDPFQSSFPNPSLHCNVLFSLAMEFTRTMFVSNKKGMAPSRSVRCQTFLGPLLQNRWYRLASISALRPPFLNQLPLHCNFSFSPSLLCVARPGQRQPLSCVQTRSEGLGSRLPARLCGCCRLGEGPTRSATVA